MFRHGDGTTANTSGMDHKHGIGAETAGVRQRSARETVRASPKMDKTFPGLKSTNFLLDRRKFEVRQIDERYLLRPQMGKVQNFQNPGNIARR